MIAKKNRKAREEKQQLAVKISKIRQKKTILLFFLFCVFFSAFPTIPQQTNPKRKSFMLCMFEYVFLFFEFH